MWYPQGEALCRTKCVLLRVQDWEGVKRMPIIPSGFALIQHELIATPPASLPSGPCLVTYGVELVTGGAQDAADDCAAYFGSFVENVCTADFTLQSTTAKEGPNDVGPVAVSNNQAVGTVSGSAAPPNVAVLVQKRSAFGGKRNRGRFYVPGVPDTQMGPTGLLGSTPLGDIQTAADALLDGIESEGKPMVILHSSGSGTPTPVTSLIVLALLATQRRRIR